MTDLLNPPAASRTVSDRDDSDTSMTRIERLLTRGFPWMRFPRALEQQFLRDTAASRRHHFLVSGLLSLLVYNGFLIADYLMVRDVFDLALGLRLYAFTPLSLILLFVGSRSEWAIVKAVPPAAYEVIVVATGLFAAASLALILSETHREYAHFYHVGFSVVIMYGNIVQRLRFWYAVIFTLAIMCIHTAGVALLPNFPHRLIWPIVSLVSSTAFFSLVANYAMERDERLRYLLLLRNRGVISELTRTNQRLQELVQEDGLTGLFNRRHFQDLAMHLWERAQYDVQSVSMLMLDIDHFKKYNDRYGHSAGDSVLREVAKVLQACVRRPEDLLARFGGEEFVAMLPHTDAAYATHVAERVRHAVEALQIRHEGSSTSHYMTVSVGVASRTANFASRFDDLIQSAEGALVQAKQEGRNRVCTRHSD